LISHVTTALHDEHTKQSLLQQIAATIAETVAFIAEFNGASIVLEKHWTCPYYRSRQEGQSWNIFNSARGLHQITADFGWYGFLLGILSFSVQG